jgi:hypothetical protein
MDFLSTALKIMPLGNSITTGTGDWASYRYWLYKSLVAAGYNVDFVGSVHGQYGSPPEPPPACCQDFDWDEEGHSGWRADQLLNGAPPDYPANYKLSTWVSSALPDIVLLHTGTNDLLQGQSAASTRDDIGAMIDTIRQYRPNAIILVAQIIPANNGEGDLVPSIPQMNALLPALVAAKQQANSPLVLVDQYTGFDVDADTHDGVHPNESGEKKMAAKWMAALQQIAPNPVPALASLAPVFKFTGDRAFTLTVTGTDFINGVSTVRWNGADRTTTFVSKTQLTAAIPATDLAAAATVPVTVFNRGPSGGASNAVNFQVVTGRKTFIPSVRR